MGLGVVLLLGEVLLDSPKVEQLARELVEWDDEVGESG